MNHEDTPMSIGGTNRAASELQQALQPLENIYEEFETQVSTLTRIADRLGGPTPQGDIDEDKMPQIHQSILGEINLKVTQYNRMLSRLRSVTARLEDLI